MFPTISSFMGWNFNLGIEQIMSVASVIILLVVLIGIISRLQSALTLAKFDVIKSLQGSLKINLRNPFQIKNIMVMSQFAISIGLIATILIMTQQINYLKNKETGYNADNVIIVKILPEDMSKHYETYKNQMGHHAAIDQISRSDRAAGEAWPWSIIQRVDQGPEMSKHVFFNP